MKVNSFKIMISILLFTTVFSVSSQTLDVTRSYGVAIKDLPEYVIITSQNTKLLGGIDITIDYKRSKYKEKLSNLEDLLQDGNKLRVRNQTDLLNSMSQLGYEYLNAYNASAVMPSSSNDSTDDILNIIDGGEGVYKVNMVFRKKPKFRN